MQVFNGKTAKFMADKHETKQVELNFNSLIIIYFISQYKIGSFGFSRKTNGAIEIVKTQYFQKILALISRILGIIC